MDAMKCTTTSLWLALLLPVAATAQGVTIAPFAASDGGLVDSPALVGLAATAWSGPVGFRIGGAMDAASSPAAPLFGYGPSNGPHAWNADLDMLFSGRRVGLELGGVNPGVFVGFGVHGQRQPDGNTATIPVWSYGLNAGLPLASWLDVDGEARYRMPHESDAASLPAGVGAGWEFRAGLALHLGSARTPTRPRPVAAPGRIHLGSGDAGSRNAGTASLPATRPAPADARAASLLSTGENYLGVPYLWGGNTPAEGFDCSGFTRYVFARHGITLPRVSRDQAWAGKSVPATLSVLRPGDLLFFAGNDGVISHVGIYAGGGWMLHSSSSRGGVGYDHLESRRARWYATHLVQARRLLP